nr:hypothetical protein [Kibdelosporangium sp. MJ126-NF4]CEL18892.1 hypothetical protein [Kibdelosporangium sp. MJ126-NF4]CTQ95304.1 hypothetical protein [Kibdelosporangium sp. MJ126-NF4]
MQTWNNRRLAWIVAVELVLLGAVIFLSRPLERWIESGEPTRPASPERPELDQDLLRAIAPVVHADLPTNHKVVWAGRGGRWFCAESPVETGHAGTAIYLGVVAMCSEYVARDGVLVHSAGFRSPLLVTLERGGQDGYVVRDVEKPHDGSANDASLRRMFTLAGYWDIDRVTREASPDPAPEARAALGLPPDAPVVMR